MTTRDFMVVDFLRTFKAADTRTIASLFFPSLSACQKRLKVIVESKAVGRARDNITNEYVYFITPPKQLRHRLLVTRFYAELKKKADVAYFRPEVPIGAIRPDAVFGYAAGGKRYLGCLEVEISNKGLDMEKYIGFYKKEEYLKYFPVMPKLFILTDASFKAPPTDFSVTFIATDFNNFTL